MRPLAAILLAACLLAAADQKPDVKEIRKSVAIKPDGLVAIQAEQGTVEVNGWDRPDVEVNARIELTPGPFQSKTAVQDTEIKIESGDGNAIQIRADYSKIQQSSWSLFSGGPVHPPVHFRIQVPRAVRVRIHTVQCPADVRDLRGELDFDSMRGDGKFTGLEGPLRIRAIMSDVEIRIAKPAGPSRIEAMRSNVSIYLPAKAKFDIDPEATRGGTLTSDFGSKPGEEVQSATKVNGGGPTYRTLTQRSTISFKKQ